MGLEMSPDDYERLAKFRLSLRWIDSMPQDVYSKITPLTSVRATEIWKHVTAFLDEGRLKSSLFVMEAQFDASGEPESVSEWLHQRETEPRQFVILLWDESTAVLTEWDIFCDFWDDFCYPSSDDVVIYPCSGKWLLLYDHEETFQFGRLRT